MKSRQSYFYDGHHLPILSTNFIGSDFVDFIRISSTFRIRLSYRCTQLCLPASVPTGYLLHELLRDTWSEDQHDFLDFCQAVLYFLCFILPFMSTFDNTQCVTVWDTVLCPSLYYVTCAMHRHPFNKVSKIGSLCLLKYLKSIYTNSSWLSNEVDMTSNKLVLLPCFLKAKNSITKMSKHLLWKRTIEIKFPVEVKEPNLHLYTQSIFICIAFVVNVFAFLMIDFFKAFSAWRIFFVRNIRLGVEDYCSILTVKLTPFLQRKLLKCFLYMVEVQIDSTMILFTILMISSC